MKSFKGAKELQQEISVCLAGPPKTIQVSLDTLRTDWAIFGDNFNTNIAQIFGDLGGY